MNNHVASITHMICETEQRMEELRRELTHETQSLTALRQALGDMAAIREVEPMDRLFALDALQVIQKVNSHDEFLNIRPVTEGPESDFYGYRWVAERGAYGCRWIMFDQDCDLLPSLPIYDW